VHVTEDIASKILHALGIERRRVVARWRVVLLYRRIAFEGHLVPPDSRQISRLLALLWERGDLVPFVDEELANVYRVDAPYARVLPVSEEETVQEADPWAVFSHLTALVLHRLTDVLPRSLHVTHFGVNRERLPLGTRREDWIDHGMPRPLFPRSIGQTEVLWTHSKRQYEFGITAMQNQPVPVYVTTVERTLCDGLRDPEKCLGMPQVLRAWKRAKETMDVTKMVECVERFDSGLLRQRVGFLLEQVGLHHPHLERWQARSQRGGSMKLVAAEPYAPRYSERWNISLNVPEGLLKELRE